MAEVVAKRPRGRPRKHPLPPSGESAVQPPAAMLPTSSTEGVPLPDWQEFRRPVTITFLMNVFAMERRTIQAKLLNLAPVGHAQGNNPLYDFRQAAAYLVKPIGDLKEQLKGFRVQDLPSHLQAPYWDAMLKRQQYELKAGNLWRTEDVLDVFGEVFIRIRDSLQLWPETLAESTDLTDEQRAKLIEMVDALQAELHTKLVALPKQRKTVNLAGRLAEDEGVAFEEPEPEAEDLIG